MAADVVVRRLAERYIGEKGMEMGWVHRTLGRLTIVIPLVWLAEAHGVAQGHAVPSRSIPKVDIGVSAGGQLCDSPSTYPGPAYDKPDLTGTQIAPMFSRPRDVMQQLQNLKRLFDRDLLAQPAFYSDEVLVELFNAQMIRWVDPTQAGEDNVIKPTRVAQFVAHLDGDVSLETTVGGNHKCLNERPDPANAYKKIRAHTYDAGYVHIKVPEAAKLTLDRVQSVFGGNSGEYDVDCSGGVLRYLKKSSRSPLPQRYLWNRIEFTVRGSDYARCPPGIGRAWFGTDTVRAISIRLIEDDQTHQLPIVY